MGLNAGSSPAYNEFAYKNILIDYTGVHRVTLMSTIQVKVARKMGHHCFEHSRMFLYGIV